MRSSVERDLSRWERGELSAADLELRHPVRAVGLLAIYRRLAELGADVVPTPQTGWERLRERLPEHGVAVTRHRMGPAFTLRRVVARPLALAAALVLFGAVVGYAAAPEAVNRRLASVWESVDDLFRNELSEDRPIRLPGGERSGLVVPSHPDDGQGNDVQGLSGDDRDHRGAGDREDSHGGSGGDADDPDEGSGDDSGEGSDDDRGDGPDDDSEEGSGEGGEDDESHEAREFDAPDD